MLSQYFKSQYRVQRFLSGPGGPLLDAFAQHLGQLGYSNTTACDHLRAAEHLLFWSDREGLSPSDLNCAVLDDFAEHLSSCRCQGLSRLRKVIMLRGAQAFLIHFKGESPQHNATSPVEQRSILFCAFCQWMRQQRGTTDQTLYNYGVALRDLLEGLGDDPGKLDVQGLHRFILEQSHTKGGAAAKTCTTALRMFLRFLTAEGRCAAGLDAAVPALAQWRLSTLPRYLREDEVERIIASCNAETPVGRRDRAILLLLARLGLRAGDIVRLRLTDIDWQGAWISVSGKSKRQTRLPMTQEVGQAIVDYLQKSRARTDCETLFIRTRAPYRAFANHSAVSVIVERAMCRAGVTLESRGAAHVLRHSIATSLLRQGASLQDIAVILRHRSISTTQIYAKVDVVALQQIAQLWPEELPC